MSGMADTVSEQPVTIDTVSVLPINCSICYFICPDTKTSLRIAAAYPPPSRSSDATITISSAKTAIQELQIDGEKDSLEDIKRKIQEKLEETNGLLPVNINTGIRWTKTLDGNHTGNISDEHTAWRYCDDPETAKQMYENLIRLRGGKVPKEADYILMQ